MNHRILIVDDERRTLLLMERTLRDLQDDHEDVEILTASDGAEALEIIMAERPALVYLDLMMPHVDGLDVCKTVKSELGAPETYIVMLTAMGQEADRQRAKEVGADLYLTKPFDPDKVLDIAKDVLGLYDVARATWRDDFNDTEEPEKNPVKTRRCSTFHR